MGSIYRNWCSSKLGKIQSFCIHQADDCLVSMAKIMQTLKYGKEKKYRFMEEFCLEVIDKKEDTRVGFKCDLEDEKEWISRAVEEQIFSFEKEWNNHVVQQFIRDIGTLIYRLPLGISLGTVGLLIRTGIQCQMREIGIYTPRKFAGYLEDRPLTIATLNMACTEFNLMDYINNISPTVERLHEYKDFLALSSSDVDILCLQEAFDVDNIQSILIPSLQERGYWIALAGKRKSVIGMTAGLMIASKFPILRSAFLPYNNSVSVDAYAKKGVLVLELEIEPGYTIIVANTHLQGSFHGLSFENKIKARKFQFMQAKQFIYTFYRKSTYCVNGLFIVGDFNTGRFKMSRLNIEQAIPSFDYVSMISSLFVGKKIPLQLKDLIVPAREQTFTEFLSCCRDYDYDSEKSMETGMWRGSDLNPNALSYNMFIKILQKECEFEFPLLKSKEIKADLKKVLKGETLQNTELQETIYALLFEILPEIYHQAEVTDHICYAQLEHNEWLEFNYDYYLHLPIGPSGILSDHSMVKVVLYKK